MDMDVDAAMNSAIETCSGMPNQFEGTIGEWRFYFRARWHEWSLRVCKDGEGSAVDGEEVASGGDEKAGWWDEAEARAALRHALTIFVAHLPAAPSGRKP